MNFCNCLAIFMDCSAYSRVFLASIASCNHSPDAQLTLVSELKAALQRALSLPESSEKHIKIQSMTSLISTKSPMVSELNLLCLPYKD
jgi:hypothetical protein